MSSHFSQTKIKYTLYVAHHAMHIRGRKYISAPIVIMKLQDQRRLDYIIMAIMTSITGPFSRHIILTNPGASFADPDSHQPP